MSRHATAATFPLPAGDYLPYLARDTADFERILRAGDSALPVPDCGEWTLRDLGEHIGFVYRWAAHIVRTGEPGRENYPPGDDLAGYYAEGARVLLTELRAADPQRPCWNFTRTDQRAAFWFRRQAQETSVHLVDARRTIGGAAWVDPLLAADGVDEALTSMLPRTQRNSGAVALAAPVLLRAADTGHTWLVSPGTDGVSARLVNDTADAAGTTDAAGAAATVTADALELLLLLWKRRALADAAPRIDGDAGTASALLSATLTP